MTFGSALRIALPLIAAAWIAGCQSLAARDDDGFVAMSFNIRFDNPADGPHAWPARKDAAAAVIADSGAGVVGLQEALAGQVDDLLARLPGFAAYGLGRDDGAASGEMTAILYDARRFAVESAGTMWCSPTPDRPSVGWDAALPRTVTTLTLRDRATGQAWRVVNAHFDHVGAEARLRCAEQIAAGLAEARGPVIVMGDFNTRPDSAPYRALAGAPLGDGSRLVDARDVSRAPPAGPSVTFHGWDAAPDDDALIDYVFVADDVDVRRFAIVAADDPDAPPSDHDPVVADVAFKY